MRDDARPELTPTEQVHGELEDLMRLCWHRDPVVRPTFLEIVTRLSTMSGEMATSVGGGSSGEASSLKASGSMLGGFAAKSAVDSGMLLQPNFQLDLIV